MDTLSCFDGAYATNTYGQQELSPAHLSLPEHTRPTNALSLINVFQVVMMQACMRLDFPHEDKFRQRGRMQEPIGPIFVNANKLHHAYNTES
jgi:hypothetical protein